MDTDMEDMATDTADTDMEGTGTITATTTAMP